MSLMVGLTLRLVAVAFACLGLAAGWIVFETHRALHEETGRSAARVAYELTRMHWYGSSGIAHMTPFTHAHALAVVKVIGPGICVEFQTLEGSPRRLCSGWDGFGETAPAWFAAGFARFYPADASAHAPVMVDGEVKQTVTASPDPVAATTRVWQQTRVLFGLAVAMTLGMSALAALALARALAPVRTITHGLKRLAEGDLATRLPAYRTAEFDAIARAFNHMAGRIGETTAERAALTQRLFEVQESERRMLARDLHDEFGQCLTAAAALAASIEQASAGSREDVAADARAIATAVRRMMATLKSALARLRPPELDELGLEASLRALAAHWNARLGAATRVTFSADADLSTLGSDAAVNLYRIAQEAITNAVRHGRPSRIDVRVGAAAAGGITLSIADDGGGDPVRATERPGFGLLGIAERVRLLGGRLAIGGGEGGLSISATLPPPAGASA